MDPWWWPHNRDAQQAMAGNMHDFNAHACIALKQAIAFEGDMGATSCYYGWDSAWARRYGSGDDRPAYEE